MPTQTLALLVPYALLLLWLARRRREDDSRGFLLAGRALTLPALVATLVTTWYGGILGIGEFAWRFGLSTWFVFGLPYYVAAIVFAIWLAPRLRTMNAVSIPDLLDRHYGRSAAATGAVGVWAGTIPVAYLLMLAALITGVTGWSVPIALAVGAVFSCLYVGVSGFRSVVRTDAFQMVLMFGGFAILLPATLARTGGLGGLWTSLPASHRSPGGGMGWQALLVWYLIALQTVVEPAFYQRVFAARTPRVARAGVIVSVGAWAVFDFLSVTTGLGARVLLPDLADPLTAYPALAAAVLGPWGQAVFTLCLFAIVMSTLDSYLFLAAATFGRDFSPGDRPEVERRRIRWGLWVSAGLAIAGGLVFHSAVEVWHHVGSVLASALMFPVLAIHLREGARPSQPAAVAMMIGGAVTATAWIVSARGGAYALGIEPMFPALAVAAALWAGDCLFRRLFNSR